MADPCYGLSVGRETKVARVRVLLQTTNYTPAQIAAIVGSSYQLATSERRKLRIRSEHDTIARRVEMLEQEIRDHRAILRRLMANRPTNSAGIACQ